MGFKGLNEEYVLAADYDLWIRFSNNCELVSFGIPLIVSDIEAIADQCQWKKNIIMRSH